MCPNNFVFLALKFQNQIFKEKSVKKRKGMKTKIPKRTSICFYTLNINYQKLHTEKKKHLKMPSPRCGQVRQTFYGVVLRLIFSFPLFRLPYVGTPRLASELAG